MNNTLRLTLAAVGALVLKLMFLGYQGFLGGLITWAILAGILWAILGAVGHSASTHPSSMPKDFQPTVLHRNIQLDTTTDRLWVRPVRGEPQVLARGQIKGWKHEWVDRSNAFRVNRMKNTISFRTDDVRAPLLKVAFENYAIADEWHARLSTWING